MFSFVQRVLQNQIWLIMLDEEQQKLSEEALKLVPVVLRKFKEKYSCFRSLWNAVDLEGTAHLAITKASRTYDPKKAGVSAYFSRAIVFSCLTAIEKEVRSQMQSPWRISMEAAQHRQRVTNDRSHLENPMLSAMKNLSDEDRKIIEERVFDGKSLRAFASQWECSTRQAKKQINLRLDRLAECWRVNPHR